MSALFFAFMAGIDLAARQAVTEENCLRREDYCGRGGRVPRDDFGRNPCIPPAILRGMVDRILLRARVERDEREEGGFWGTVERLAQAMEARR